MRPEARQEVWVGGLLRSRWTKSSGPGKAVLAFFKLIATRDARLIADLVNIPDTALWAAASCVFIRECEAAFSGP